MSKKATKELISILQDAYFKNKYNPTTHYIAEQTILHSCKIAGAGGGEMALNDANTKMIVGESDFNGTQLPTDAHGLIRAGIVRYGKELKAGASNNPALINYSEKKADFPAWLLNSELVAKVGNTEVFRQRIVDFLPSEMPQSVPSEWAKEFERTIKTVGGQDMQLFLNSTKGSALDADEFEYLQVVLFGIKFSERKSM